MGDAIKRSQLVLEPAKKGLLCNPGHYRDGNSCEVLAVGAAGIKPAVSVTSFAISHASVYLVSGDRHRTDGQGALLPSFEFRALVIVLSLTIKKG
jgi:hypothetical protein